MKYEEELKKLYIEKKACLKEIKKWENVIGKEKYKEYNNLVEDLKKINLYADAYILKTKDVDLLIKKYKESKRGSAEKKEICSKENIELMKQSREKLKEVISNAKKNKISIEPERLKKWEEKLEEYRNYIKIFSSRNKVYSEKGVKGEIKSKSTENTMIRHKVLDTQIGDIQKATHSERKTTEQISENKPQVYEDNEPYHIDRIFVTKKGIKYEIDGKEGFVYNDEVRNMWMIYYKSLKNDKTIFASQMSQISKNKIYRVEKLDPNVIACIKNYAYSDNGNMEKANKLMEKYISYIEGRSTMDKENLHIIYDLKSFSKMNIKNIFSKKLTKSIKKDTIAKALEYEKKGIGFIAKKESIFSKIKNYLTGRKDETIEINISNEKSTKKEDNITRSKKYRNEQKISIYNHEPINNNGRKIRERVKTELVHE